MDRMNIKRLLGLGAVVGMSLITCPVRADEGYRPTYSASPSASAAEEAKTSQIRCSVKVISGNNALAPAEVKLDANGQAGNAFVDQFAFDFGDGKAQTGANKTTHRYSQAGTYTVTVSPLVDNLKHDTACTTTVTLKAAPLSPIKVECTSLTISSTNVTASDSAKVQVRGYDSKSELQGYKFQANDYEWESGNGNFEVIFNTPGDYILKGFVKAANGEWVGGEGECRKEMRIGTAGITKQPETGPTMAYWFGWGSLALAGLGAELWQKLCLKRSE